MKKSYDKMCQMHHELLKKYEDEVNMGAVKQGLINQLKADLDECKRQCQSCEAEINELRSGRDELDKLRKQNRSLKIDVEDMKRKYEEFRRELDSFVDEDFLDEIKTLKKKYADALKLNKYYENLLFYSDKHTSKVNTRNRVKFAIDDDVVRSMEHSVVGSSLDDDSDITKFSNLIIEELNSS